MSQYHLNPYSLAVSILIVVLPWTGQARCEQVDVAEELERLMAIHGFSMRGGDIEGTREVRGRAEGAELVQRLRTLLEGFDHIIVQRPGGGVERLLILGEKAAYVPPEPMVVEKDKSDPAEEGDEQAAPAEGEIVLETRRQGASHAVILAVEGDNGKRVQRVLLLDTGADYVVLPTSLIPQLGIPASALSTQPVQTANGRVEAQLGKLAAVWIGERRVEGVDAAFIADDRLGNSGLLGMSLLGRFRVTIDDEHNRVVLAGK